MVTARFLALMGMGICGTVLAQETGVTSQANPDFPILDSPSLVDRPSDEPAPEPSGDPLRDLTPILDQISGPTSDGSPSRTGRVEQRWRFIPFGRVRMIWDDNIFISNTDRKADFSYTVSPGIAFGWGDYKQEVRRLGDFQRYFQPLELESDDQPKSYIFASYVANAAFFVENTGENVLDHDALLAGRWESSKLTIATRFRYQTLSGVDLDVGDRVNRKVFTGNVNASYLISEKTTLDLNLLGSNFDFEEGVDWSEKAVETYIDYQVFPKTRIALGGRFGVADVRAGSNQTFQQALMRGIFYASAKVAISASGGLEWRQYDSGIEDDLFAVFDLSATYQPFDGTALNLTAFRRNSASVALINENITSTGFAFRFRQRFLQRYFLGLDGGYQRAEYLSVLPPELRDPRFAAFLGGVREDDVVYIKPSISFDLTKNFSVETAYQFQRNDSTVEATSFRENLVSLQVNMQF